MKRRDILTFAAAGPLVAGCAQTQHSTALANQRGRSIIRLQRSLPTVLPSGAQVLPKTQLVLLPAESAAGMLVPVPFLAEAVAGALDRSEAATEAAQLGSLDPYTLAQQVWQGSPLLSWTGRYTVHLRSSPDSASFHPSQPASAGGLFFGVHRLRKDQLHTFRRVASTS